MKRGLVLGKFMPVHNGHLALVDFALKHCDELVIFLCYHPHEPIKGSLREAWLKEIYYANQKITIETIEYDPLELSDSSQSSKEAAYGWAGLIRKLYPNLNVVFSSEEYGDFLSAFLNIPHIGFDNSKSLFPVSSSAIRSCPAKFWSFIPAVVRPYFVTRIAVVGSESTGKSTLTKKLAAHYKTQYVEESAREIIAHTKECTFSNLEQIAYFQARTILEKLPYANRFLFVDTEINITKSYSKYLFNRDLIVEEWIAKANSFSLYLYLEPDCPHVQDGTRLNENERLRLDFSHKEQLQKSKTNYISLAGNWEERFTLACKTIEKTFLDQCEPLLS